MDKKKEYHAKSCRIAKTGCKYGTTPKGKQPHCAVERQDEELQKHKDD